VALAGSVPIALAQSPSAGPIASAGPSGSLAVPVPWCIVRPELTEGPYFVDERLDRSDIRADSATGEVVDGIPLTLTFAVSRLDGSTCHAYPGVYVDVWHCDAEGAYSDVTDPGFDTSGQDFLRGYQVTDENGLAMFTTIYPGWYDGRTVHIHFKIRSELTDDSALEFTSQLFFDDALTDQVYLQQPYAARGERTLRNEDDGIYGQSEGLLTLTVSRAGDGYAATFEIGIQVD
jgi:protocatechuate 3,4-dioxygenase beta subunit